MILCKLPAELLLIVRWARAFDPRLLLINEVLKKEELSCELWENCRWGQRKEQCGHAHNLLVLTSGICQAAWHADSEVTNREIGRARGQASTCLCGCCSNVHLLTDTHPPAPISEIKAYLCLLQLVVPGWVRVQGALAARPRVGP